MPRCIYPSIFNNFRDIAIIGRKLPHFYRPTPPLFSGPAGVTPSEFREDFDVHKTRMNGLSYGEESMTICSAVLIQYQRVTYGRTDVQPISITCFSIADARKTGWTSIKLGRCGHFNDNLAYPVLIGTGQFLPRDAMH